MAWEGGEGRGKRGGREFRHKRTVSLVFHRYVRRGRASEHSWTVSRSDLNSSTAKFRRGCHTRISRWTRSACRVWMNTPCIPTLSPRGTTLWLVLQLTIGGTVDFFFSPFFGGSFLKRRDDPLFLSVRRNEFATNSVATKGSGRWSHIWNSSRIHRGSSSRPTFYFLEWMIEKLKNRRVKKIQKLKVGRFVD